jgi:outer membrane protein assembly factor BamB
MISNSRGVFTFGLNNERSFNYESEIGDSISILWTAETNGSQNYSSPVIYDDILFIGDLSGRLYAFDRNSGAQFGYKKFDGAIEITPVVNNFRIICIVNNLEEKYSTMAVYDYLNGRILSETIINGKVNAELLKYEDGVVVVTTVGEIIKFNYAGNVIWKTNLKRTTYASPTSDDKFIYLGNSDKEILKIELSSGLVISKNNFINSIESKLTLNDGNIFFGDNGGIVYCVNSNLETIWKYDTGSKIINSIAADDNSIIASNLAGNIYSLNKNDGSLNYSIVTGGMVSATPLIFNDNVLIPLVDKKMILVNKKTGVIISELSFDRRLKTTPIYYENILYFGSDRGLIHAYKKAY